MTDDNLHPALRGPLFNIFLAKEVHGEFSIENSVAFCDLASTFSEHGNKEGARKAFEHALELVRSVPESPPQLAQLGTVLLNLGMHWHARGEVAKAGEYIRDAYEALGNSGEVPTPILAMAQRYAGTMRQHNGDLEGAERLMLDALRLLDDEDIPPIRRDVLITLAALYEQQGNHDRKAAADLEIDALSERISQQEKANKEADERCESVN